ncbi:MAG: ABC transporter substrate-binding protein [Peptostreptococcaceae bacterium]|nr:ABC transporter substrate-binding protein [Peptostreptococcaceae bacterium]
MKKRVWKQKCKSGIAVLMTAFLLMGCGPKSEEVRQEEPAPAAEEVTAESKESEEGKSHYPVKITTYNFAKEPVELTFEKAPEKVVAIYQSPIETMLALGLEDRVVAAVMLDDPVKDEYKAAFEKITYFENRPSKEEVLAMEPDFLLSWSSLFSEKNYGDIGFWNERGTNTYIWQNAGLKKPNTLENEYQDILNIGKIFDVEEKAIAIVDNMKEEIEKAKKYVEGKEKVRTVILEVEKEGQYRIYGLDSIGGDIASQVGADLIAKENATIGKEELVELNPDVIFSVYYGDSIVRDQAVDSIVKDKALESISAVEKGRVHPIVLSEVYASGVRTMDGIRTIIAGIYPELK